MGTMLADLSYFFLLYSTLSLNFFFVFFIPILFSVLNRNSNLKFQVRGINGICLV